MTIKELRKAKKLSQAAFAAELGIAAITVSQLETGRMKLSPKMAARVKDVFGEDLEVAPVKETPAEKPGKAAKQAKVAKPAKAAKPTKAAKQDKAAKPTEVAKPAREAKPSKAAMPAKAAKQTKAAKPAKVAKPAKAPKPVKAAKPAKTPKLEIYVQSPYGGNITPEQIAAKMPEGTESCFVRVDQNLIWWVRPNGETGAVEIWNDLI